MRKNLLLFILTMFCAGSISVAAQNAPKQISGGVLNGKATNLVKPAYPAAARAVRAEGAVNVQVTIDEEGNVIAASAVSGHPLLRAAAVEAARASKFSPTVLSGQAVKVSGVIVYNFVAGGAPSTNEYPAMRSMPMTVNWFQVGQSLSSLENTTTMRYFEPSSFYYMIPVDWTAEREQIKRLEELKKAEMEQPQGDAPKERVIEDSTLRDGNNNPVRTTTTVVTVSRDRKVSSEVTAISQSLMSSIQGRLSSNESNLWNFNLGINVSKALLNADSRDSIKRSEGVKPLRESAKNAPAEISAETLDAISKVSDLAEKGIFNSQDLLEINREMMKLNVIPPKPND